MISAMAKAAGIECEPYRQQIRFPELSTAVIVSTASTTSVVSRTSIGAFFDEMALWRDDSGANPAKNIIEAFRPSLLTMPGAFLAMISAPWSTTDPHSVEYERTGKGRYRDHAPTWEANPYITEEDCRELSDSEDEFMRQYAAEPLDSYADSLYPVAAVRLAMGLK
jgi:hypothetical protein